MEALQDAFDRADVGRDGEILASDALVAISQLGRQALKSAGSLGGQAEALESGVAPLSTTKLQLIQGKSAIILF